MPGKSTLRRLPTMPKVAAARPMRSLDPADWASYRRQAHEALDAALDHIESVATRPVWRPVPDPVKQRIAGPTPWTGLGLGHTLDEVRRLILPYTVGNTHPRFFGWVHGSGTAGGVVAEMLAAAMNVNAGGREHAAVYVERQIISWMTEVFGFPQAASGLLVSGTSMATLIALTAARDSAGSADTRRKGVARRRLTGYASVESHSSVAKAFEILGLGREALRLIPVDAKQRMDPAALARQIAEDRATGFEPFAIIGTAGTVNTGATDPLAKLARIARSEKLWLHVDGAFGALARLSPETRSIVAGIDRAHSIAFDFHKWLHVPYDAGAVLVRDGVRLRESFASRPDYLKGAARGLAAGEPWYCELGPELSRSFRAFKVWFTLKEHGLDRLGEKIADNCRQAQHLARLVSAHPDLELLAPVALNIVCFRYRSADATKLDDINGEVVVALQEKGIAAPSTTRIGGQLAIRVNLTNHRTTLADLDLLIEAVVAEAQALPSTKPRPGPPPDSESGLGPTDGTSARPRAAHSRGSQDLPGVDSGARARAGARRLRGSDRRYERVSLCRRRQDHRHLTRHARQFIHGAPSVATRR
ncbi:MAG: pyridoxal-dependent decarboxylase [Hyphomicrobiaceae bacterium]